MAQKTSSKSGKKRSKKQQAIFRRRRIVVGIAAIVLISFLVFCLYSLSRGIVAVNREIHHADVYAITWPGTRTGSECVEDQSTLPKVDRGVYSAQLSIEGHPKAKSDPIGVTIE